MQAAPNVGKAQKTGGKGSRKEQLDFAEGEKAAAGNDSNNDSNEAEAEEGEDEMDQRYESEDSQEAYVRGECEGLDIKKMQTQIQHLHIE